MVLLQAALEEQERKRLDILRQRDQERAKRFVHAKNRSIGIDKSYLDKQVEEKRLRELAEKEEKLTEAENLKELVRVLDTHETAIQQAKRKSLEDVKRSLEEQIVQPKNNAIRMDGPLNLNACGPSSLQFMSGEDHNYEKRKKEQQEQVQYWCAQHTLEKKRALEEERRREREYAEYVFEQDRIRAELEEASLRKKQEDARLGQLENMEYARLAKERKRQEIEAEKIAQAQQTHYLQTCPLLTEDTELSTNANAPHRFRPDHFKGFSKQKVTQIYQENDRVVEEKQEIKKAEANAEAVWSMYHSEMIHETEQTEKYIQRQREEERRTQCEILQKQKEELKNRRREMEMASLPAIGTDFFQRFGQSCR
ncbi:hypothetical protein HJC23_009901 [Cyclotella cryptica]|uniref:RIB43A-like with coiled-coils protein 1 n=1 Tax=Cyclotella cryptica TaxID=29204 RepID=A0ABD3QBV8_9STRA|eukprot:CCRYP_007023-RA/>CCRYP_007023-RA protein AED:0.05 eAED:0.05 QI:260/1/1/1/0.66/0.5/4/199/366